MADEYIGKFIYFDQIITDMARISVDETVATPATSKSKSLRTTIPAHVVNQLKINDGDLLTWELDKVGNRWKAIIVKGGKK